MKREMTYYYGKEESEKYGELIINNCCGQTISKKIDDKNCYYGLPKVAERLNIDMWDLLKALEGMLIEGTATMTDDSTYRVKY